jgi:hypothetical protein
VKKYVNHFKKYLDGARIYNFEQLPTNRDLFIIGEDEFNNNIDYWKKYLDKRGLQHPNNFQTYRFASITHNSDKLIDLFLEINIHTRFHGIHKKLPKTKFRFCIEFWSWGERPYLIVDQKWLNAFLNDTYSIYALIDFIGVRSIIEEHGIIPKKYIKKLKKNLHVLSVKHSNYLFVTFADNLIIKTNWSGEKEKYNNSYKPELFLKLIENVFSIIKSSINLDSYAVISQGANFIEEDLSNNSINTNNYFFFDSISTPFIELFEIDDNVRKSIKKKIISAKTLYLSESFLLSLKFNDHNVKSNFESNYINFNAEKSGITLNKYLPIDLNELLSLLKI